MGTGIAPLRDIPMGANGKAAGAPSTTRASFLAETEARGFEAYIDAEKGSRNERDGAIHVTPYWVGNEVLYVNRFARGERDITDAQIDDILARYDIDRMTLEDKERMLAELVEKDVISANAYRAVYEEFHFLGDYPGKPDPADIVRIEDWIEYFRDRQRRMDEMLDLPIYAYGERLPPRDRERDARDFAKLDATMRRIQSRMRDAPDVAPGA